MSDRTALLEHLRHNVPELLEWAAIVIARAASVGLDLALLEHPLRFERIAA